MHHIFKNLLGSLLLIALLSRCTAPVETIESNEKAALDELPFQVIPLENLDSFQAPASNWQIMGQVSADFLKGGWQTSAGHGILANQSTAAPGDLFTEFSHGDLELDIEFLVPKGANSGIYFQSRYELQILDSWGIADPDYSDCGGIYERWDENRPAGERGYEGYAPRQNAALAPGLWQKFHVKFRAPRFDASGNKITNAQFEEVILNGIKIHENVELSGPTRGASEEREVALAPLRFQGDQGEVAFRNFRYKLYGHDTLTTSNVTYQYYEIDPPVSQLPDFDLLEVVESGTTQVMDVNLLAKQSDGFAFRFQGELDVKRTGDYLFHLFSDDGSRLFINNALLIDHDGNHDLEPKRGLIALKKGKHALQIDYFNNVWGKGLMLLYEGPEQELQTLQGLNPYSSNYEKEPLIVTPTDRPELIRSFFEYRDEKRSHVVSIGHPEGIHYSYDVKAGSLLKVWRGDFADVTDMWQGRGHSQLLVPLEVALEMPECNLTSPEVSYWGYELLPDGRPVFIYEYGDSKIFDSYKPNQNGLQRTLWMEGGSRELKIPAGFGPYMEKVNADYFSVAGRFYLKNLGSIEPKIMTNDQQLEVVFPLNSHADKIEYSILW